MAAVAAAARVAAQRVEPAIMAAREGHAAS